MKVFGADNSFNQSKIDELRNREKSAPAKSDGSAAASTKGKSGETVSVSGLAREIGKVKATVRDVPDVRREKVEALREKIDKGEYFVSGDEIAGKIIEDIIKQNK